MNGYIKQNMKTGANFQFIDEIGFDIKPLTIRCDFNFVEALTDFL